MTTEQKAQSYDKALEKAKELIKKGYNVLMPELFPELKENEDSRIKTNIIRLLRFVRNTNHQYSDDCNEAIDWLEKQKPAEWSEEDEKMYQSALWHIKNSCGNGGKNSGEFEVYNWLKSLRPQPKQEWGEEDDAKWYGVIETEEYMLQVVRGAQKFDVGNKEIERQCEEELDWLKSLRPQKQWKPSDAQMEALKLAYEDAFEVPESCVPHLPLKSLYNDLKQL